MDSLTLTRKAPVARRDVLPLNLPPRVLSRVEAAAYVGISAPTFDRAIKDRLMPKPFRLYGRVLWDRRKLDAAVAALDSNDAEDDAWDVVAP
jgi:predicted DNA-binding transcriptional regulator AlpA